MAIFRIEDDAADEIKGYRPYLAASQGYLGEVAKLSPQREPVAQIPFALLTNALALLGVEDPFPLIQADDLQPTKMQRIADDALNRIQAGVSGEQAAALSRLWDYLSEEEWTYVFCEFIKLYSARLMKQI